MSTSRSTERLLLAVADAERFEIAAHQLAVVDLDRERPDAEIAEYAVDDGRQLGVVADRELILADDVDVALVELAEAAALRALAAIDALDLVAAEREGQIVLVLGDVARERHREIETQRELGLLALLHRAGRLHEVDLPLGLAAFLGQEDARELHDRRLDRQEAEALEIAPDRIQHRLERDLIERQKLEHARHGAGLRHGHRNPRSRCGRAASANVSREA